MNDTPPAALMPALSPRRGAGFSLIEVIAAVAIFATAVVAAVALLGPATRSVRDTLDVAVAARLADGVAATLERAGFSEVVTETAAGPLPLVADADGSRLLLPAEADNDPVAGSPPGLPAERRFFLVEVGRASAPEYAPGDGVIVLAVRVMWPFRRPGLEEPVPEAQRALFCFNTVLTP